jgi:hypothetical protein
MFRHSGFPAGLLLHILPKTPLWLCCGEYVACCMYALAVSQVSARLDSFCPYHVL